MEKEAKPRSVRLLLEFRLKLSPKFEWSNFPFTEKGGTCCSRERESLAPRRAVLTQFSRHVPPILRKSLLPLKTERGRPVTQNDRPH